MFKIDIYWPAQSNIFFWKVDTPTQILLDSFMNKTYFLKSNGLWLPPLTNSENSNDSRTLFWCNLEASSSSSSADSEVVFRGCSSSLMEVVTSVTDSVGLMVVVVVALVSLMGSSMIFNLALTSEKYRFFYSDPDIKGLF